MSEPLNNLGLYGDFDPCDKDIVQRLNFNFEFLDNVVQLSVIDMVDELPDSPLAGDRYILNTDNLIYYYNGEEWVPRNPQLGYVALNRDEGMMYHYDGTDWAIVATSGVTNHGALTGLADDDHPQYHNDARGDVRYYTKTQVDAFPQEHLNFLTDPSFENGVSDWSLTAGVVIHSSSQLYTDRNKYMADVNFDGGAVFSRSFSIPETDMLCTFKGWLRSFTYDINISVTSGATTELLTVGASSEWQQFNLPITPPNATILIEISVDDPSATAAYFDELYFGPFVSSGGGVSDHGLLTGLTDDDHTQYHNNTRGDARYYTQTALDGGQLDNRYYTETETDALLAANSTGDRARGNHTGTQALSTLSQSGASTGQVATWNGSAWAPQSSGGNSLLFNNGLSGENPFNYNETISPSPGPGEVSIYAAELHPDLTLPRFETGNLGSIITHAGFLQTALWEKNIILYQPGGAGSTSIFTLGESTPTATGTATAAAYTLGANRVQGAKRVEYAVTTASTSAIAGWRQSTMHYHRPGDGGGMGSGGFFIVHDFGVSRGNASNSTRRMYCGLHNGVAAPSDANPSGGVSNACGVGCDSTDTNLQFIFREGTNTATKIDLGSNFPKAANDNEQFYRFIMNCSSNQFYGYVQFYLADLVNGYVATYTATSNFPLPATMLAYRSWASVGGTNSVIGMHLMKFYSEVNY